MPGQTNERAIETHVEEILVARGGWKSGRVTKWDKERELFPAQVFAFIADTQPKLWAGMRALHAAGLEVLLLTTLAKELDAKRSLHVLVQRMDDNNKIVTRYMDDKDFGDAAFTVLSKAIYESIPTEADTLQPD